jgi:hypothetical protein
VDGDDADAVREAHDGEMQNWAAAEAWWARVLVSWGGRAVATACAGAYRRHEAL